MQNDLDTLTEINNRFFDAMNASIGTMQNTTAEQADGTAVMSTKRDIWKHKEAQYAALQSADRTGYFSESNSILSFDEAIADAKDFPSDFSRDKALQAEEEGNLTVYSTEPIENGAYIYTSKEDAKAYSENGKIYEKVVSTLDVAWDSIEGGMYAEVDSGLDNFILEKLNEITYNDYEKERDKWEAEDKVEKGTRQFMFNPFNGNYEYWEKGDDALLKLIESKDFKEVKYGRSYGKARNNVLRVSNTPGNSSGQVSLNSTLRGGLENDAKSNGGSQKNESSLTKGSGKQNNGYNNGATRNKITDTERSTGNGGALSDAQNSPSTRRGLESSYLESATPEELFKF